MYDNTIQYYTLPYAMSNNFIRPSISHATIARLNTNNYNDTRISYTTATVIARHQGDLVCIFRRKLKKV